MIQHGQMAVGRGYDPQAYSHQGHRTLLDESLRTRKRCRSSEKGRGLRHFSMQVCKKVEEKGQTTYNEVRRLHSDLDSTSDMHA
jgi:hypothetical protein